METAHPSRDVSALDFPFGRKASPMIETRIDAHAPSAASARPEEPVRTRSPFVRPTVEEMGRLKELTLVGGSL